MRRPGYRAGAPFFLVQLGGASAQVRAGGCTVAALGDDVRRGDARVRSAYRGQLQRYFENVERFLGDGEDARQRSILAVSALAGAIVLSRAVDDEALSDEILDAVSEGISELR